MDRLLPGLERRLKAEVAGGVHFDRFTRGRYATDASHYQIMPLGVVTPRTMEEAERAIEICRIEGVPVTPRGGGSSQAGQTVNHSVIVDCSKHLNTILDLDVAGRRARVEPGIVLDDLNRQLKAHGLWFPVDVSTASRATIGGMTANNSCGGRSLRYGNTRENVIAIDALLADGGKAHFGPVAADLSDLPDNSPLKPLARDLFALGAREADEIAARFPKVQRRVGGYNIDALVPGRNDVNLAHILVGSEGTLAFSTAIELKLSPLLGRRAVGACHFGSFHEAMAAAQHIVKLAPDRGRAGRRDHDRARARHRHVPADARGVRAGPARGAAAGRVRRGARRERAPAQAPARTDGRSRLRLAQQRREVGRRGRRARCQSCRPRSPSCAPPASTS